MSNPTPRFRVVNPRGRSSLVSAVRSALELSGCRIVGSGPPGRTPLPITFDTPGGERVHILVYAVRAPLADAGATTGQVPQQPAEPPAAIRCDEHGAPAMLLLAVDLERRVFIGADPMLHETTACVAERRIAARHCDRVLAGGWHAWEHDRDDEEDPVEILVGFTGANFLRYVCFERDAFAEEAGHRHALAERPWSRAAESFAPSASR